MLQIRIERPVAGGRGLGHAEDGRVVLVSGGLDGELVRATVERSDDRVLHAGLEEVLERSPDRTEAMCPTYLAGCGGCDLQHLSVEAQPEYKARVVSDALRHLGRILDPKIVHGPPLAPVGFRSTVRAAVIDGAAGLRMRGSRDVVRTEHCPVTHPLVDEVLSDGRFPAASEVLIRAGVATGERLVVTYPSAEGSTVPSGVRVVGSQSLKSGKRAAYHEEIDGRSWQVSAHSFFQTRRDGAQALVDTVDSALGAELTGGLLVDAHCGVGLLGGAIAARRRSLRLLGIELSRSAVQDARRNLADLDARILATPFDTWRPEAACAVIADPPRKGLGRRGADQVLATGANVLVLVSCDAAALGRDAGMLEAAGMKLDSVTMLDMFPYTTHVECVSRFTRQR